MRTKWQNDQWKIQAVIYPFDGDNHNRADITVSRHVEITSEKMSERAEVNWPAIGTVGYEDAKKFAHALDHASVLARAIEDKPVHAFRVVGVVHYNDDRADKLVECVILGNNEGQVRDSLPKEFTLNFVVKVEPLETG